MFWVYQGEVYHLAGYRYLQIVTKLHSKYNNKGIRKKTTLESKRKNRRGSKLG